MIQAEKVREAIADPGVKYLYRTNQTNFEKIPGGTIAYWIGNTMLRHFNDDKSIGYYALPKQGLSSGDNNRFLRLWFEVSIRKINFHALDNQSAKQSKKKWFPHNKGGQYRKWWGNYYYVINWENDGAAIRTYSKPNGTVPSVIRNPSFYFHPGITWSSVTSGDVSFRLSRTGFIFDSKGPVLFIKNGAPVELNYVAGFLNSVVASKFLNVIAPTLDFSQGAISKLPMFLGSQQNVLNLVKLCVEISSSDWDASEESWNYQMHPVATHIAEHNPLTIWLILLFTCLIRITSSPPSQTMAT